MIFFKMVILQFATLNNQMVVYMIPYQPPKVLHTTQFHIQRLQNVHGREKLHLEG